MRSNAESTLLSLIPPSAPASLLLRLRRLGADVLQRWRDARAERAHRIALSNLDAATRRDLGLDADHFRAGDAWPPADWTLRHFDRYL